MGSPESRSDISALSLRVGKLATSVEIADALVATWNEINTALTPILGRMGVAGLYRRSLHLTASRHSCFAGSHEGLDLAALHVLFAQQNRDDAETGGSAFLQTFHELLVTLIGPSLTEQLLCTVLENSSNGPPVQDIP